MPDLLSRFKDLAQLHQSADKITAAAQTNYRADLEALGVNVTQGLAQDHVSEISQFDRFDKKTAQRNKDAVPVQLRSHFTSAQKEQFHHLAPIFDPNIPAKTVGDKYAKAGALRAEVNPGTIRRFETPLNALGLTFHGPLSDPNSAERQAFKEADLNPRDAAGHILIGPEAVAGTRRDVIEHELSHLGGFGETEARMAAILRGQNIKENMSFLGDIISDKPAEHIQDWLKFWDSIGTGAVDRTIQELTDELKTKQGKKNAN